MWVHWRQCTHNLSAICATIWQTEKTLTKHAHILNTCRVLTHRRQFLEANEPTSGDILSGLGKLTKNRIPVDGTKPITTLYHSLNPRTTRDPMTLPTRDFTTVEFRHVARILKKQTLILLLRRVNYQLPSLASSDGRGLNPWSLEYLRTHTNVANWWASKPIHIWTKVYDEWELRVQFKLNISYDT